MRAPSWLLRVRLVVAAALVACGAAAAGAQGEMPNPKEMSGVPRPASDLPKGTVSVRVIRGSFSNNITGQAVEFVIDGVKRSVTTDTSGRAQVSGLRLGARVKASTVVDGERLDTQDITMGDSGVRVMLVATDPEVEKRAAEDKALASTPPVRGIVTFGPESRVIIEQGEDALRVFYLLEVINTARTPVDIGGPLIIDLPRAARGASMMQGSTKQATAKGPRVTVLGPFPPGTTTVDVGFELPTTGGAVSMRQTWPVALPQVTVLTPQTGTIVLQSPQIAQTREITDRNQPVLVGTGPGLAAGQSLIIDVSGLPHHTVWPRYAALALAGLIIAAGIWGAATGPRARAA
jgi:hypothetical protein